MKKLKVGGITFDNVAYDEAGDVLYLHVGEAGEAVDFDESPDGHGLRFDANGSLIGVTIMNAQWLLEQGCSIELTVTERLQIEQAGLSRTLKRALRC